MLSGMQAGISTAAALAQPTAPEARGQRLESSREEQEWALGHLPSSTPRSHPAAQPTLSYHRPRRTGEDVAASPPGISQQVRHEGVWSQPAKAGFKQLRSRWLLCQSPTSCHRFLTRSESLLCLIPSRRTDRRVDTGQWCLHHSQQWRCCCSVTALGEEPRTKGRLPESQAHREEAGMQPGRASCWDGPPRASEQRPCMSHMETVSIMTGLSCRERCYIWLK